MTRTASHAVLFAALVLVSTAGPFLVAAQVDATAAVFLRLAAASVLLLAWSGLRGELRLPAGEGRALFAGALLLAAHFVLWVKAFDLTDYASNLLLLVAQPVVAAAAGARLLGERTTRATWLSVALAAAGLSIIAGGDFSLGPRALLGDALSVAAAFAMTFFYVVTRRARAAMPLPAFLGVVTGVGALAVLPVLLLGGARLAGYPPRAYLWLAALTLLTTLGGHGLMNLAARHVRLFTLNVVIVLEPALGIAMGAPLFGATVTPVQIGGGVLLAAAVVVGLLPERATAPARAGGAAAAEAVSRAGA